MKFLKRYEEIIVALVITAIAFTAGLFLIRFSDNIVKDRNAGLSAMISEDEYNTLCIVSQAVGKNITEEVLEVSSMTGADLQEVVFKLYPRQYAEAINIQNETDTALGRGSM